MRLEAKNVSFRYHGGKDWILEDISLSLSQGERAALVGPSGLGKSTLLKLLAGFEKPNKGKILLDGKPLPAKGASPVQLIYQHPEHAINPRWKMKQVLSEAGMYRDDVIRGMGIERVWLKRYPRELSGGELQRFCIARALFEKTRFLLADEISAMLDAITQAQIWEVILSEAALRNLGLLVVTHNKALAERVCERIIELPFIKKPL